MRSRRLQKREKNNNEARQSACVMSSVRTCVVVEWFSELGCGGVSKVVSGGWKFEVAVVWRGDVGMTLNV